MSMSHSDASVFPFARPSDTKAGRVSAMPTEFSAPSPAAPSTTGDAHTAQSQAALLLDDPQEWSAFGRPCTVAGAPLPVAAGVPSDPTTCTWDSHVVLDGMHCAACALTIEDALRAVPGVLQADVSAATRRARVVWRPDQVQPSQWMQAVRKAGYHAMPAMDAFAREQR